MLLFTAILLTAGFALARAIPRDRTITSARQSLGRLRKIVVLSSVVLLAAGVVVADEEKRVVAPMIVTVAALLVGAVVITRLMSQPAAQETASARALVGISARAWRGRVAVTMRAVWGRVAPGGWGEIRIRALSLDSLMSFRAFVFVYALAVAAVPFVMAALAVLRWGGDGEPVSLLLRTMATVAAFLLASCLSLGLLVTAALFAAARYLGVITWRPAYGGAVRILASASGVGTVFGALVASLVPVVGVLMPSAAGIPEHGTALDGMRPDLLIELSGAGAIAGFIVGQLAVPLAFSQRAENLAYRAVIGPAVFAAVVAVLSWCGVTPALLLRRVAAIFRPSVGHVGENMTDDEVFAFFAQDWRSMIVFFQDREPTFFPEAGSLMVIVVVAGALVAVWSLVHSLRRHRD